MSEDVIVDSQSDEIPAAVADAWAAVLIDIHEKRLANQGDRKEEDKSCQDQMAPT